MRRIMMFNHVAADGSFATADGRLDWVVQEPAIDRSAVDGMPGGDTILFGRRTYEMFESYWPHALDDSTAAPHGRGTAENHAMAVWINNATKLVFSRTRKGVTWEHSRLLGEFDPAVVSALKRQPGKDILLFGSGTIVSLLAQHGLIDEYQFVVSPLFLAGGRPVIGGLPQHAPLRLLEATAYPSGVVSLRYAPGS
jgi:dihydrofolate reductase